MKNLRNHYIFHFAFSKGLLGMLLLAPLLWGTLPIGYEVLNAYQINEQNVISSLPLLLVGMRMLTATVFFFLLIIIFCFISRRAKSKKNFWGDWNQALVACCKSMFKGFKLLFLILLVFCYFGARWIEMEHVLTLKVTTSEIEEADSRAKYGIPIPHNIDLKTLLDQVAINDDGISNSETIKIVEIYDESVKKAESNIKAISDRTQSAIRKFGYLMGLLLVVVFTMKNVLYRPIFESLAQRIKFVRPWGDRLSCVMIPMPNLTTGIFFFATFFLIIAAGSLCLYAREPLFSGHVNALFSITFFALLIALLGSFAADFKQLGKLNGPANNKASLIAASIVISFFLSFGSMLCAFIYLRYATVIPESIIKAQILAPTVIANQSWTSEYLYETIKRLYFFNGQSLLFKNLICLAVIGLLGTVIAPVAQLWGVFAHDSEMKKRNITNSCVNGGDWLRIGGGFEPLMVLIVGFIVSWEPISKVIRFSGDSYINSFAMILAALTIVVIATLKIAEVWGEKSAAIRNQVFAKIRGTTRALQGNIPEFLVGKTKDELRARAHKLSLLKYFDDRNKLRSTRLSLGHNEQGVMVWNSENAGEPLKGFFEDANRFLRRNLGHDYPLGFGVPRINIVLVPNGRLFFNNEDTQTNSILKAHFSFLESQSVYHDIGNRINSMAWLMRAMGYNEEMKNTYKKKAQALIPDKSGVQQDNCMPFVIIGTNDQHELDIPDIRNSIVFSAKTSNRPVIESKFFSTVFEAEYKVINIGRRKKTVCNSINIGQCKKAKCKGINIGRCKKAKCKGINIGRRKKDDGGYAVPQYIANAVLPHLNSNYDWIFIDVDLWNTLVSIPDSHNRAIFTNFIGKRVVWFGEELDPIAQNSLGNCGECIPFITVTKAEFTGEKFIDESAIKQACQMANLRFKAKPEIRIALPERAVPGGWLDQLSITEDAVCIALAGTDGRCEIIPQNDWENWLMQSGVVPALVFIKTSNSDKKFNNFAMKLYTQKNGIYDIFAFRSPTKSANGFPSENIIACTPAAIAKKVALYCGARGTNAPWNCKFECAQIVAQQWDELLSELGEQLKNGTLEKNVYRLIME